MSGLDLEHLPPGDPDRTDTADAGDTYARIRAQREALQGLATKDFPLAAFGFPGLVVRYRRLRIEPYRDLANIPVEWERWAQLLIDACDGFFTAPDSDGDPQPLLTDLRTPVTWDTLAQLTGVPVDPDRGVRGAVIDVFGGHDFEAQLVTHAQAVDRWMTTAAAAEQADLEKGQ